MKRNRSAQAVSVPAAYEIVCSKYPTLDVAEAIKAFLQAAIGPGRIELARSGYIPLSADLQARVSSAVDAISSVDAPKPQ